MKKKKNVLLSDSWPETITNAKIDFLGPPQGLLSARASLHIARIP
jgi:hypothetical protein